MMIKTKTAGKLVFILYKYFPFGGLQRDFLNIARCCQSRGHDITVYTMHWEGEKPEGFDIYEYKPRALFSHVGNQRFHAWCQMQISQSAPDLVVGFNKMPGLDIYYAADTCYEHKVRTLRSWFYTLSFRYRHFSSYEHAVFSPRAETVILLISSVQRKLFLQYYGTQPQRLHMLPPGIARDRQRTQEAPVIRRAFRQKHCINEDEHLLLFLGSGFKTKGLDRALLALAALPVPLREKVKLFVVGKDNFRPFKGQAQRLKIEQQVVFFPGMEDVPALLQGADALIHPAYNENTGTVLLEALVAGLPVLCTEVCGYAHYIKEADAGLVTPVPFRQATLNRQLADMVDETKKSHWSANALAFEKVTDLYGMPEKATDIIEETFHSGDGV